MDYSNRVRAAYTIARRAKAMLGASIEIPCLSRCPHRRIEKMGLFCARATRWSLVSRCMQKLSSFQPHCYSAMYNCTCVAAVFTALSVGAWPSHISNNTKVRNAPLSLLSLLYIRENERKKTQRTVGEREKALAHQSLYALVLFVCAALANQQTMRQKRQSNLQRRPIFSLCHFAELFRLR